MCDKVGLYDLLASSFSPNNQFTKNQFTNKNKKTQNKTTATNRKQTTQILSSQSFAHAFLYLVLVQRLIAGNDNSNYKNNSNAITKTTAAHTQQQTNQTNNMPSNIFIYFCILCCFCCLLLLLLFIACARYFCCRWLLCPFELSFNPTQVGIIMMFNQLPVDGGLTHSHY
ncbi:unnamed protein product [Polarella glacialis]|uniref:Uncharacterized protein n=1 Tax=Polarella glacialis TaxID=89957 RepID=A0A813K1A4_POLGL|nr:unnamed protein product [Polarella glacialis]